MALPKSSAGTSAKRRYRSLRAAGRARRWLTRLAIAVVAAVAVGWLWTEWAGLIAAGLAVLGDLVRHRRAHSPAAAWRKGAAGERATARRLRALELAGYIVLHDRALPHSRANVDHLVIGPAGVFVIDSKKWHRRTTIRAAAGTLWAGKIPLEHVVRPVIAEARQVSRELTRALGRPIDAVPVVAVHGARLPRWRVITVRGVPVMRASRLRRWIAGRARGGRQDETAVLAAAASNAFPPYVESD
ncbi:nuclease-related domain-containing protein [Nonomuraea sp. NPDC023979]|uniref:nuclease-related domain-containing protein n=1 Tax=Nonomuraea sp. NPDC023979 TaxID=3154796 RepID=UPI0033E64FC3